MNLSNVCFCAGRGKGERLVVLVLAVVPIHCGVRNSVMIIVFGPLTSTMRDLLVSKWALFKLLLW